MKENLKSMHTSHSLCVQLKQSYHLSWGIASRKTCFTPTEPRPLIVWFHIRFELRKHWLNEGGKLILDQHSRLDQCVFYSTSSVYPAALGCSLSIVSETGISTFSFTPLSIFISSFSPSGTQTLLSWMHCKA